MALIYLKKGKVLQQRLDKCTFTWLGSKTLTAFKTIQTRGTPQCRTLITKHSINVVKNTTDKKNYISLNTQIGHSYTTSNAYRFTSESNSGSTGEEIPRLLWTSNVLAVFTNAHHWTLSWARWIPSKSSFCFLNIHFNITLPATPRSKWPPLALRVFGGDNILSNFSHPPAPLS
jgi:hypothetical protein